MSWWDYGYQIKGMGNRTVIVDNNTRNNTHIGNYVYDIVTHPNHKKQEWMMLNNANHQTHTTHSATVGLAMASTEEMAYPVMRALDVISVSFRSVLCVANLFLVFINTGWLCVGRVWRIDWLFFGRYQ